MPQDIDKSESLPTDQARQWKPLAVVLGLLLLGLAAIAIVLDARA